MFYYLQNDFALGISALKKARALSPKAPLPPFYLAMSREALGDAPGALRFYQEAEVLSPEKTPQTASILVAHGRLLFSLGRFEESIAKDQLAIEADTKPGMLSTKEQKVLNTKVSTKLPRGTARKRSRYRSLAPATARSTSFWEMYISS